MSSMDLSQPVRPSRASTDRGPPRKTLSWRDSGSFVVDGLGEMGSGITGGLSSISEGVTSGFSDLASGLGDNFVAMSVLSAATQAKLMGTGSLSMAKIGRIIKNMKTYNQDGIRFEDDDINKVVNALYASQADDDLLDVFDMFFKKLDDPAIKRVQVSVSCEGLPNRDGGDVRPSPLCVAEIRRGVSTSSMEWAEIGKTEVKLDTNAADFARSMYLDFKTSEPQHLRFQLRDAIDDKRRRLIGEFETLLADLMVPGKGETKVQLSVGKDTGKYGSLTIRTKILVGLQAPKFKQLLLLCGEDVPQYEIDELFTQVDADGSGCIEFEEFKVLALSINPQQKTQQKMAVDAIEMSKRIQHQMREVSELSSHVRELKSELDSIRNERARLEQEKSNLDEQILACQASLEQTTRTLERWLFLSSDMTTDLQSGKYDLATLQQARLDLVGALPIMQQNLSTITRTIELRVTKCVVCTQNNRQVLLVPCSHVCVCSSCANEIDRCPLCHKEITSKIQVQFE